MTARKKNLLLIQITIFLLASTLLYNTYSDKNKQESEILIKIESESDPDTNSFTDVEYSGFDLNGNRYVLNAGQADFKTETPDLINMKKVVAKFYLKDGTILTVVSRKGLYNNVTLDMKFIDNVKANYSTNTLKSDSLYYSNSNANLIATGNVRGESIEKGEFIADNVEYDLKNKTVNFSMFGSKQVNIKIKD
ncbi:LPS export ABC transporter periplasmic protein LptC [Pelagibacteraceae bacterium]|nr:LPS export ABC transporter periplasmic protein LptC [Pelagibacteraceae bacterium]